jgi:[acyl-carrier-protein] S-malonyltransferase
MRLSVLTKKASERMARLAFLFPGQGSQKVGMGKDLVERHPHLREFFARADAVLGFPLTQLCFEGPDSELVQTQNTQPAIFVVSMAILDVLRKAGVGAEAAAGHSLGEYGALVCAGVLEFEDALRLVRRRGELMAGVNARTPGAMAAVIGLSGEAVAEACRKAQAETGGVVEPANYNTPQQTVISGQEAAVLRAMALAQDAKAEKVVRLQVGAPFHCSLMSALQEEFAATLEKYAFKDPAVPVVANVTGDYVRTAAAVKDALRRQVAGAVRWTDSINRLAADGFDTFVEVGPGRTLVGLNRQIQPDLAGHSTGDSKRLDTVLAQLKA